LSVSETARTIEELTKVPFYFIAGSTRNRVAFISTEGGPLALWSVDPHTGNKLRLTTESVALVADPRRERDLVYFTRDAAKGAELHKIHSVDAVEGGEKLVVDVPEMRVLGLASSGNVIAFTAAGKEDVGLYLAESGSIEKKAKFASYAELTDSSEDYLVGFGDLAKNPRSSEIFIFKLGTSEYSEYTPVAGSVNKAARIRGSKILFESNLTGKNRLHICDVESTELSLPQYRSKEYEAYDAVEHPYYGWTEQGKIWAIGKKDGEAKAFVDGKTIETLPGYLWGMALLGSRVYTSHTTIIQPMRIIEVDISTGKSKTIVDNPLPPGIRSLKRRSKAIRYKSFDGRLVQAFVIDDGTDIPKRTMMYVHGGPWSDIVNSWGVYMNSLNLSGYNIIAPNYRGSTGFGEEFRKLDIGDPGGGDLEDIAYATRWAKENGLATECAIAGYSYGGYMTLLALGKKPDMWDCGLAGAPVVDWKEQHELSDAVYRHFIETLFDNKTSLYDERSPKTYAKNVKKPVCIIALQNDSRTPLKPVLTYAVELLTQGVKFELHSTTDTGHAFTKTSELMSDLLPWITFLQKMFPSNGISKT
jgi:dienelactone hydrolase